ncbi:MAG TPA: phosphatase PAP2 family protein [Candidatus Acidoferrum sp.]|nr:phosphatase PAP2 family protein [Candidatus Acidoferrum sp.]
MNSFDASIIHFFNSFARRSVILDNFMSYCTLDAFLIGAVPMALFWYAWVQYGRPDIAKRKILTLGILISVVALGVARVLALSLPFRMRPFNTPALHFQAPYGVDSSNYIGWSSFPSDRTTLFVCVAAILWMVSRRLGILAFVYTFLVICLPTVYIGVHFPTDVLAGAALGIGVAAICNSTRLTNFVASPVLHVSDARPGLFHATLFLWTFEIGELFHSVRSIILHALRFAKLMA